MCVNYKPLAPEDAPHQPIDLVNTCTIQQYYFDFVYYGMGVICKPLCPNSSLCQPIDLANTCTIEQCYFAINYCQAMLL